MLNKEEKRHKGFTSTDLSAVLDGGGDKNPSPTATSVTKFLTNVMKGR